MTTTALPQIAPFKSERAAKMAMTKAEKAYYAAMGEQSAKFSEMSKRYDLDAWRAEWQAKQDAQEAARLYGCAVYAQAQAQKFYVRTYAFGPNATRDLIAANMD